MPAVIAFILTTLISSLIARVLLGAGLSILTYTFINDLVLDAQNAMGTALYSLPANVLALIRLFKIDFALSIIMSAMGIAAFVKSAKIIVGKA